MEWSSIIKYIEQQGLNQSEIGLLVGLKQPHISRLRGGQPIALSYTAGAKLIELRDKLKGKSGTQKMGKR